MYTYVRQTKLSNICGRSDYITNATGKHKQEDVFRNDGFVVAFHIVLRDGAGILNTFLRQKVRGVGLLQ